MSGADADWMARELGKPTIDEAIANLNDRMAYVMTVQGGQALLGQQVRILPPFEREANATARLTVKNVSRRKYGMNREELDRVILRDLAT